MSCRHVFTQPRPIADVHNFFPLRRFKECNDQRLGTLSISYRLGRPGSRPAVNVEAKSTTIPLLAGWKRDLQCILHFLLLAL